MNNLRNWRLVATCVVMLSLVPLRLCFGQSMCLPSIPGLSPGLYYQFSGVWDENPKAGTYSNHKERLFSWGMSDFELTSVLIDLGVEQPYIEDYSTLMLVLSIQKIDETKYRFECNVVEGPAKEAKTGYLIIILQDGLLRFEEHFPTPQSAFGLPVIRGVKRLDGPIEHETENE
jgi:hypothetical protein